MSSLILRLSQCLEWWFVNRSERYEHLRLLKNSLFNCLLASDALWAILGLAGVGLLLQKFNVETSQSA